MKVLLAHAYFLELDAAEKRVMKPYPPLGILYLSAFLKEEGHEIEVFDGTFARPEDFRTRLRHFQPEIVGFYANMMTRHHVLRLRQMIDDPRVIVVAGGPDPPYYAEDYLDSGFDFLIAGEGEACFAQLIGALHDPSLWPAIAGLIFRRDGKTQRAPEQKPQTPLDQFPMPDRGAIDIEAYLDCWEKHHRMRPISLITSRGCPFQCTWCSHNVYGYSLRKRSPENVLAELVWLNERYRFDHYWFADDVFTIKHPWNMRLGELLLENRALIKPFECISRADRLTPEIVEVLRQTACFRLWVGAESGSQRLLDLMKRGVTRAQVIEAINRLRAAGIQTGMFFMWGFMDEGYDDVLATIDLAAACNPDIALTTIAYPIKGTGFHNRLSEQGLLREELSFAAGTDRDILIAGQAGPEVYNHANQMLHDSLRAARLRSGGMADRARATAHHARARLHRLKLKRAFAARDRAAATLSATAG